jgi:hypothetical protein
MCLKKPGDSTANFGELLLGALGVADVAHGFLVRPALFPRLAHGARAQLARFNPALSQFRFHSSNLRTSASTVISWCAATSFNTP